MLRNSTPTRTVPTSTATLLFRVRRRVDEVCEALLFFMRLTHHIPPSLSRRDSPARRRSTRILINSAATILLLVAGCKAGDESNREVKEAPPSTPTVLPVGQADQVHVADPKLFPLADVSSRTAFESLNATGQVQPDVSREVPVLSIANGRVTSLHVGLGDFVHKGQLVMEVQSPDVATAFNAYLKAVADEQLTNTVLTRDKLLFDKGAIAKSQLEVAENGETDSLANLRGAEQELQILGVDRKHPGDTVKVYAPISGIIVAQNTTTAGAAGLNVAGIGGSLTIADLSHVWVICDVYENDLAQVHLGEHADIRLNAFPSTVRQGTISDIGAVLDPSLRTAKVRIQVPNPGNVLRIGMFATATFHGARPQSVLIVPDTAILHLHDREFVYVPTDGSGNFRRIPVQTGQTLPGNVMAVSGLSEGQKVVAKALEMQEASEQ